MSKKTFFHQSPAYFDKLTFVQSILKSSFQASKASLKQKNKRNLKWVKPISKESSKEMNKEEYVEKLKSENMKLDMQFEFLVG